ncbi:dual specificity protein kinase yak1 [Ascosphaera atra]|nr:dual specificity protein kinase yak1 [Ascosphaera atra]
MYQNPATYSIPTAPQAAYGHQMLPPQMAAAQPHTNYAAAAPQQPNPHDSLFAQATARAGRQRSSTMEQQQAGIPPSIQRVASRLDPNAPIRLQPSPAYYPPPADAYGEPAAALSNSNRRRAARGQGRSRDFIRTLEDGAMGGGWSGQWPPAGNPAGGNMNMPNV